MLGKAVLIAVSGFIAATMLMDFGAEGAPLGVSRPHAATTAAGEAQPARHDAGGVQRPDWRDGGARPIVVRRCLAWGAAGGRCLRWR